MSEWITDREAVETDADYMGAVWVTNQQGEVYRVIYAHATIGAHVAWQPIVPPEPYVKPKRWQAKWNDGCWSLYDAGEWADSLISLDKNSDEHREAAERIAAIYEEVMP